MEKQKFEIYNQNNSVVEEAFSFLKTNFNFSNGDKQYKSLAILSSNPKEGKTTIAINLSINFANSGIKTLLVDADLRKPVGFKRLSREFKKGLSNYLTENIKLEDVIRASNIDNLYYMPCGSKVMNQAELLSSKAFEVFLREIAVEYELIIFDTPAIGSVTDGYIIASKADATILTIKAGEVKLPKLKWIKEQLEKAKANVIGVVLNNVEQSEYRKNFESYNYFSDDSKFGKDLKRGHKWYKIFG